ncbi:MAG: acyl-CoA thioesterase [Flavobacteriales bacterium]|nr:acyl-CoA thioesterase [Flavobacteriales bacterium]
MSAVPAHLVQHLDIPIAWGEQDAFGHLNNVFMFRYMESVRMHYLERIGVLRSLADDGVGVLLASTTCDYLRPVHWPATLHAHTGCTRVGNTSFTLEYVITDASGEAVARGSSVQVMYDYQANTKVPVPEDIRKAIERIQTH